ncbi:zinc ABC transporter substrate-binding protein [Roseburia sp. MUC/MUC-530-WT-4D]|uniref:Zinc ABC transporter substrate-binding protein n=1 Tax=Roseburia porci TaxID=2605790 RepID=A0A6L5YQJ2_9FIRM|nr:metal ABC transporter substrate-binding protein [Roseburia porci]MCI5517033.1 metal ABC transporter substrate-binding protein [Roseburia sp.]MDD6742578.1 metal ABC transporter substrate-binding protein [Roseburia porci]MST74219.1 zinc ABC transporter substrate-binding protein [Roseburia porci]
MKKKNAIVFAMLAGILIVAIALTMLYTSTTEDKKDKTQFTIVTSFYPMYVAAENVIGDVKGVTLENLSEPQTGCLHDYQLTTEDMKLLSKADLFIVNGGGIETFLTDVASNYPELDIIEACQNVPLLDDGDEENAHAWMSISDYRIQLATIESALEQADPEHADAYHENAKAYDEKLAALQDEQDEIRQAAKGQNVIIFHEAYDYVAEDYGLNVSYVLDLDEERQVSAGEVADVLDQIQKDNVSYIFAEELYGSDMGKTVESESNVKVIYLDACNRGDYSKDSYLTAMQSNIDKLREAFCK